MHDVGLVTICDTRGPSIPLFFLLQCHPGLDHKQDAHAQTNMAEAISQVAPSQLPAGLRSSGVHAKLHSGPRAGEGWRCDAGCGPGGKSSWVV